MNPPFTKKYFWLIVLIAIALGFLWPQPGLEIKPYLFYILIVMMTLSCLKIDLKQLKEIKTDWWRYLFLMIIIFLLPTIIVLLFKNLISKEIFIGLAIAAAVPSAVSSVFTSDLLGGEPSKALVTTTFAHILSPIVTPLLVWISAREIISVDFWSMSLLISELILIPLIIAQIIKRFHWHEKIVQKVPKINTFLLLILTWGIIAPTRELIFANLSQVFIILGVITIIIVAEVFLSIWFGRTKKEDITWSIVNIYKNSALSSLIALNLIGPVAVIGSVCYIIMCNITVAILQVWSNHKTK